MTSVWPALCPPWKRTTTSARSDSQSTILPLPSSPHWAPTTATLAIRVSSSLTSDWVRRALFEHVAAIEPARLFPPIRRRQQRRDGDPPLGAQGAGAGRVGVGRDQHAAARRRRGQRAQDRVGVERKAGRRLGCLWRAGLIAAAAAELAQRPKLGPDAREKGKADAGVVFEAAVLDRVDGDLERRDRRREPVEHGAQPLALQARPLRQVEPVEGGARRTAGAGRGDEAGQQR